MKTKIKIPFGDLKIPKESRKYIKQALDENYISGGPRVKILEKSWGELFDYKHNLAVSNGTCADMAACMTLYDLGAKRDDEIIAPALGFIAVGNSILAAGFKPKFVDIERETLNINPDLIEESITDKTKAIMTVHNMGKPCDMTKIKKIARKHDLFVIEDCCEAHGAKYKDKFVGSFGDVSTFSFYVAHLISCGDGGMVSTNSKKIYNILTSIKNHGRKPGDLYFNHIRLGLNFRMNDLTASIGIPQLVDFWSIYQRRKKNLYYLLNKLNDLKDIIYFNKEETYEDICPHAFSMTLKNPKHNYRKLYSYLESKGIQCKRNFGSIPTQHKAFEFLGYKLGDFPEAEYVGDNGLHFGIHQYLNRGDLDHIVKVVKEYFK